MQTKHFLRALGIALLAILLIWVITSLRAGEWSRPVLKVIDRAPAFSGELPIPQEQLTSEVQLAKAKMESEYKASNRWNQVGHLAEWIAFSISALIGLIAGYMGKSPAQAEKLTPQELAAGSIKLARVVGVLAALSAMGTGIASKAKTDSESSYNHAIQIQQKITSTIKKVHETKDPDEAQATLLELHSFIQ